jgi:hypothetical protein
MTLPIGYALRYDEKTGRPYRIADPEEAEEVGRLFARAAAGLSQRKIAAAMRQEYERRWTQGQVFRCLHYADRYVEDGIIEPELAARARSER